MKRRIFLGTLAAAAAGLLIPHHGRISNTTTAAAWEQTVPEQLFLPSFEHYGHVVFQIRHDAPNQIYIVGQLHEHPVTEDVNQETIQTQRDIYRIGEQLIKERELELIILEGLSADDSYDALNETLRKFGKILQRGNVIDAMKEDSKLERILNTKIKGDASEKERHLLQATAGYWLASTSNLRVAGAEDKDLHRLAVQGTKLVMRTGRLVAQRVEEARIGKYRLSQVTIVNPYDHINQLRTAYILHNTPLVIEREDAAKRISRKQAMVVIGVSHIPDCIEFVRDDYLKVPAYPSSTVPPLDQPLGYVQAGYGVTVIMPRTIEQISKQK